MHSLFFVLSSQHGDDFAPMRCNAQTVGRLVSYFEDVVTENNLSALVIEGRCLDGDPARENEQLTKLFGTARHVYLFSCDESCTARSRKLDTTPNLTNIEELTFHSMETGPFILVMDPRFCGLLASYQIPDAGNHPGKNYEMIWSFDPNVGFTALEYLMARIGVQRPDERLRLERLLNVCTTRTCSARMALSFTTKLAMLLQRQNDLETAINSISSAISSTLELDTILQSAVEEVGRALKVRRAALVLWEEDTKRPEKINVYERDTELPAIAVEAQVVTAEAYADGNGKHLRVNRKPWLGSLNSYPGPSDYDASAFGRTGDTVPPGRNGIVGLGPGYAGRAGDMAPPGPIEVPITYRDRVTGVLMVEDDSAGRQWGSEEILMVRTVSDQLAVAISHARLFRKVKAEAATDAMTMLYNYRFFKERLDREIKLADRNQGPVSLILLDLDHLKNINDTFGHRAGDECIIHVAALMRSTMRDVDIPARYGGEEFVVILPQCERHDAMTAAERLRSAIADTPVPNVGRLTASVGVATYPGMAASSDELIEMADRAMYLAKASGRNMVRSLLSRPFPTPTSSSDKESE
jgi:diguanylate cyclase (GGDEF)-like protein